MSTQPDRSDDLEALFDSIVEQRTATETRAPAAAAPPGLAPANESVAAGGSPGDSEGMFQRIGQLTRTLHDALRQLGYDRKIEEAAHALPDAHDRLNYIAKLSGDAAERVLGEVERGQALCAGLGAEASALGGRWDQMMEGALSVDEFKALAGESRGFVKALPGRVADVHGQFSEIMMAQDFHDLSGQVIKRVAEIVQRLEKDLLVLLLETCPPEARPAEAGMSGPPVPGVHNGEVVKNQAQVDQLLESLGF